MKNEDNYLPSELGPFNSPPSSNKRSLSIDNDQLQENRRRRLNDHSTIPIFNYHEEPQQRCEIENNVVQKACNENLNNAENEFMEIIDLTGVSEDETLAIDQPRVSALMHAAHRQHRPRIPCDFTEIIDLSGEEPTQYFQEIIYSPIHHAKKTVQFPEEQSKETPVNNHYEPLEESPNTSILDFAQVPEETFLNIDMQTDIEDTTNNQLASYEEYFEHVLKASVDLNDSNTNGNAQEHNEDPFQNHFDLEYEGILGPLNVQTHGTWGDSNQET